VLKESGSDVLDLTRRDVDLLALSAASDLASRLLPTDTLIVTSALAPVKSAAMLLDNLRMMQAVCEAVTASPVAHLIYISSDAVYRDSAGLLSEDSCAEPGSLHGAMHITREVMLKAGTTSPLALIRPTLIFGTGDPHNGYGPNRFIRLAKQGKEIVLFGEGEERRDHVFIGDVAEIVRRCVFHRATGVVNAVSGTVTSFREAAELAVELTGSSSKVVGSLRTGPMPHNGYRAFDAALLRKLFPDFSPTSLREGFSKMEIVE
jgi:nucleoside-diphosphate-sugar epimerase